MRMSADKIYYMVANYDLGYPQYLDGFRNGDEPVWRSLQSVDPFIKESEAAFNASKTGGTVVRVTIEDGYTKLV